MKRIYAKHLLLLSLLGSLVAITGCEQQGPAEEAGEQIDNMIEDSVDTIENAAEDIADDVQDATN